jgi:hypothetical protein
LQQTPFATQPTASQLHTLSQTALAFALHSHIFCPNQQKLTSLAKPVKTEKHQALPCILLSKPEPKDFKNPPF